MKRIKQIIKKVLLIDEGPKPLFKRKKKNQLKLLKKMDLHIVNSEI